MKKRAFEQINQKLGDLLKQTKSVVETHQAICQDKKWLDTQEVCQLLGISKRTLQQYRDDGFLPYVQIEGKILYKESDVLKILENNYKAM